jgi:hypothetical protein
LFKDAARPGCPETAVNEQNIDAVRVIIENDPHSTYEQIEDISSISSPAINSIIHNYLKLREVCARWVPHQLIKDQKQLRIQFYPHSLKRFYKFLKILFSDLASKAESRQVVKSTTDPHIFSRWRYEPSRAQRVWIIFVNASNFFT